MCINFSTTYFLSIGIMFYTLGGPIGSVLALCDGGAVFDSWQRHSVYPVLYFTHIVNAAVSYNYNCCVSVFQACNARIEQTTLQLIYETCTSRFSSTSNTLVIINNTNEKNCCYFPIEKRGENIIYSNQT